MHRLPLLLTGALLGSFAAFGLVHAQKAPGSSGSVSLPGADLAEIQQLYSRYSQGTDFGNAEMWINVFADDGIFQVAGSREWIGREQITEYRTRTFAPRQANYTYRHWNSSWVITPTGDGRATGRVYWIGFDPSADPIVISDTGYYEDIYVKTSNGWRIKQRRANPDPSSPDGGKSRPSAPAPAR
jgi:SnoaL-like protein